MRKTKIIATLGPSTFKPEKIQKLVMAGLDVMRINMSHAIPFDRLEELNQARISNGNFEYTDSTNGEQTPQFWTLTNDVTLERSYENFTPACDVPGSSSGNIERGYIHTPCQVYHGESYFINFWVGYSAGLGSGTPSCKVGPCGFGDRSLTWNAATEGNYDGASIQIEAFDQYHIAAGTDNGLGGQNALLKVTDICTQCIQSLSAHRGVWPFLPIPSAGAESGPKSAD